jgi:hypothetical protein
MGMPELSRLKHDLTTVIDQPDVDLLWDHVYAVVLAGIAFALVVDMGLLGAGFNWSTCWRPDALTSWALSVGVVLTSVAGYGAIGLALAGCLLGVRFLVRVVDQQIRFIVPAQSRVGVWVRHGGRLLGLLVPLLSGGFFAWTVARAIGAQLALVCLG